MMMFRLSPQSIEALATVISGGAFNDTTPPIGIYRSGPALERFMRGCNIDFRVGASSRYPALVNCLLELHRNPETAPQLVRVIEMAAHPGSFSNEPEKFNAVLDYLNSVLRSDGFELQQQGHTVRLIQAGHSTAVVQSFANQVITLDFDTVQRDLDRALRSADDDPEDAVTGACSTVESVCRSVIIELGLELPAKKDISGLYRAVANPLGLAPDRPDLPAEIVQDVRKVLSGLATT